MISAIEVATTRLSLRSGLGTLIEYRRAINSQDRHQIRRASTVMSDFLKGRTKAAVSAAASKLKMSRRLSHRPETENLRGQAKTEESPPRPSISKVQVEPREPSLKDVRFETKTGPRRLIIACDGTWTDSNQDTGLSVPTVDDVKDLWTSLFAHSDATLPSNITRLCRALNTNVVSTADSEPKPTQIVFYHQGIGTDGGLVDKIINGATGNSISEHIRECYGFLCNNWQHGDEIFLFGFSRGAYTVRAISALINDIGLLNAKGMEYFYQIFEDWKDQNVPEKLEEQAEQEKKNGAKGAFAGLKATPPMPSQAKPPIPKEAYINELVKRGYTRQSVPIKVVGVFDTVGALGIPPVFGFSPTELIQYSFVNTKVSQAVEHAIQALALDDHRAAFSPTVWEQPDSPAKLKSLTQVWFPGAHSNIGGAGGYEDQSLANDTLAWMVSQLQTLDDGKPVLDFDTDYLHWVFQLNVDHCNVTASVGGYRGWALGKMKNELSPQYYFVGDRKPFEPWIHWKWQDWRDWMDGWKGWDGDLEDLQAGLEEGLKDGILIGHADRTPGRYESCDAKTGRKCKLQRPLRQTNEKIHPSARVRVAMHGKGLDDKGEYFPKGLKGFELVGPEGADATDPFAVGFRWVGKDDKGVTVTLEEDTLGVDETALLIASRVAVAKMEAEKKAGAGVAGVTASVAGGDGL